MIPAWMHSNNKWLWLIFLSLWIIPQVTQAQPERSIAVLFLVDESGSMFRGLDNGAAPNTNIDPTGERYNLVKFSMDFLGRINQKANTNLQIGVIGFAGKEQIETIVPWRRIQGPYDGTQTLQADSTTPSPSLDETLKNPEDLNSQRNADFYGAVLEARKALDAVNADEKYLILITDSPPCPVANSTPYYSESGNQIFFGTCAQGDGTRTFFNAVSDVLTTQFKDSSFHLLFIDAAGITLNWDSRINGAADGPIYSASWEAITRNLSGSATALKNINELQYNFMPTLLEIAERISPRLTNELLETQKQTQNQQIHVLPYQQTLRLIVVSNEPNANLQLSDPLGNSQETNLRLPFGNAEIFEYPNPTPGIWKVDPGDNTLIFYEQEAAQGVFRAQTSDLQYNPVNLHLSFHDAQGNPIPLSINPQTDPRLKIDLSIISPASAGEVRYTKSDFVRRGNAYEFSFVPIYAGEYTARLQASYELDGNVTLDVANRETNFSVDAFSYTCQITQITSEGVEAPPQDCRQLSEISIRNRDSLRLALRANTSEFPSHLQAHLVLSPQPEGDKIILPLRTTPQDRQVLGVSWQAENVENYTLGIELSSNAERLQAEAPPVLEQIAQSVSLGVRATSLINLNLLQPDNPSGGLDRTATINSFGRGEPIPLSFELSVSQIDENNTESNEDAYSLPAELGENPLELVIIDKSNGKETAIALERGADQIWRGNLDELPEGEYDIIGRFTFDDIDIPSYIDVAIGTPEAKLTLSRDKNIFIDLQLALLGFTLAITLGGASIWTARKLWTWNTTLRGKLIVQQVPLEYASFAKERFYERKINLKHYAPKSQVDLLAPDLPDDPPFVALRITYQAGQLQLTYKIGAVQDTKELRPDTPTDLHTLSDENGLAYFKYVATWQK